MSSLTEFLVTLFPGLFGAHRFICGDFAAGMLLAAGAGALASGWDGGALRPPANADVLAAAPAAYSELRALTAQSARESTQKAGAFAKRFYPLAKAPALCADICFFLLQAARGMHAQRAKRAGVFRAKSAREASFPFPLSDNSAGRQHSLLSPLDCLSAKAGGAAGGGAYAPFILTARWLGWHCYCLF